MKRFILFLLPFLIAVLIFFGVSFFLNRQTGKGALLVTSTPESNVYLDGKLVGKTPFCIATENCKNQAGINIGDHEVRLSPVDVTYPAYNTKININKLTLTVIDRTFENNGESTGTVIGLTPLTDEKTAQIQVTSFPDKVNIFLDENPVGITPLVLTQISQSDHDLRLTLDGYQDKILKIKTTLGFQTNLVASLGIKPDLSDLSASSASAVMPGVLSVARVLILDTPTGFLRVRENNSLTSSEIARIKPGELYELVDEKNDWFEIKLSSPSGELGWISSQYAIKK